MKQLLDIALTSFTSNGAVLVFKITLPPKTHIKSIKKVKSFNISKILKKKIEINICFSFLL